MQTEGIEHVEVPGPRIQEKRHGTKDCSRWQQYWRRARELLHVPQANAVVVGDWRSERRAVPGVRKNHQGQRTAYKRHLVRERTQVESNVGKQNIWLVKPKQREAQDEKRKH